MVNYTLTVNFEPLVSYAETQYQQQLTFAQQGKGEIVIDITGSGYDLALPVLEVTASPSVFRSICRRYRCD